MSEKRVLLLGPADALRSDFRRALKDLFEASQYQVVSCSQPGDISIQYSKGPWDCIVLLQQEHEFPSHQVWEHYFSSISLEDTQIFACGPESLKEAFSGLEFLKVFSSNLDPQSVFESIQGKSNSIELDLEDLDGDKTQIASAKSGLEPLDPEELIKLSKIEGTLVAVQPRIAIEEEEEKDSEEDLSLQKEFKGPSREEEKEDSEVLSVSSMTVPTFNAVLPEPLGEPVEEELTLSRQESVEEEAFKSHAPDNESFLAEILEEEAIEEQKTPDAEEEFHEEKKDLDSVEIERTELSNAPIKFEFSENESEEDLTVSSDLEFDPSADKEVGLKDEDSLPETQQEIEIASSATVVEAQEEVVEEESFDSMPLPTENAKPSKDYQTLKRYAALKERDLRESLASQDALKKQLIQVNDKLSRSEQERRRVQIKLDEMQAQYRAASDRSEEHKHHLKQIDKEYEEKIKDLQLRIDSAQFRASKSEKRLEEFRDRVRRDLQKIRSRERELANRLELQKRDAEALLSSKDEKLLLQKREIDRLEFEFETLKERMLEDSKRYEERALRLTRAIKSLKLAQGILSSFDDEVEDLSASSEGSSEGEAA